MTDMPLDFKIMLEGWDAAKAGRCRDDNPYLQEQEPFSRYCWDQGWLEYSQLGRKADQCTKP